MNIAFPLPFASMVSILRFDALPEGAVSLSTLQRSAAVGDQGVYLRLFGARAWRLPLDETIEVEARDDGLVARHDMWIFGRLFLRLDYAMQPAS
jgi:hypothetical protein